MAYVLMREEAPEARIERLRRALKQQLPEWMRPEEYVYVNDMNELPWRIVGLDNPPVKLQGFRFQVSEVQMAILNQKDIKHCRVEMRQEAGQKKRLVAHIVIHQGEEEQQVWANWLRAHVRERLPEYMVPQAYVFVDHLPPFHGRKS